MSKVKEHAEAFEAATDRAAQVLGFTSTAEYLQERGFNHSGTRFLAVEILHELRADGWELTFRDAEDAQ